MLGAVFRQRGGGALHVAALATGEVCGVEGERIALRELGLLPLVVGGESANELVVVERFGQIGLVAGGAKLRCMQKIRHDRFGVALGMAQYLIEGHLAGNAVAFFIDDDGGNTHFEAGIAVGGKRSLHRVADGASETVRIHGSAIDPGVFSESAAQNGNGGCDNCRNDGQRRFRGFCRV